MRQATAKEVEREQQVSLTSAEQRRLAKLLDKRFGENVSLEHLLQAPASRQEMLLKTMLELGTDTEKKFIRQKVWRALKEARTAQAPQEIQVVAPYPEPPAEEDDLQVAQRLKDQILEQVQEQVGQSNQRQIESATEAGNVARLAGQLKDFLQAWSTNQTELPWDYSGDLDRKLGSMMTCMDNQAARHLEAGRERQRDLLRVLLRRHDNDVSALLSQEHELLLAAGISVKRWSLQAAELFDKLPAAEDAPPVNEPALVGEKDYVLRRGTITPMEVEDGTS